MATQNDVRIRLRDGGLGSVNVSDRPQAIVAPSTKGPLTANLITSPAQLDDLYGSGPLVEEGKLFLKIAGLAFIACRATTSSAATGSAIVTHNAAKSGVATGTSVVTKDAAAVPFDAYDLAIEVVKGGTIGVQGIVLRATRDGGRTWTNEMALGVATEFTIPNSGMTLEFAAGTLIAGESYTLTSTAPIASAANVAAAIATIRAANKPFDGIGVPAAITGADATTLDLAMVDLRNAYRYQWLLAGVRDKTAVETVSDWKNALLADFDDFASVEGRVSVTPGYYLMTSAIDGAKLRRNGVTRALARAALVKRGEELGRFATGSIIGIESSDDDGAYYHDAAEDDELAKARFLCFRKYVDAQGWFIFASNTMAATGSDYSLIPYVRVVAQGCRTARVTLLHYMNASVRVSEENGLILEADAQEVEGRVKYALRLALLAPGDISPGGIFVVVDRTVDILATKLLPVSISIVPLGYVQAIPTDIGLVNPAVQAIAA